MSEKTYADWLKYHATIFSMRSEPDIETLISWSRLAQEWGFTPAELFEATKRLAAKPEPEWKGAHINILCGLVHQIRDAQRSQKIIDDMLARRAEDERERQARSHQRLLLPRQNFRTE